MLTTVTFKVIIEGMKRMLFWLLVLVLSLSSIFAADKWEYMVVGLGTACLDPVSGKITAYKNDNSDELWFLDGETSFEKALDILGREGWEVVTVVGDAGGTQEFILKRPYDESRYLTDKAKADTYKPIKPLVPGVLVELEQEEYVSKMCKEMSQALTNIFKTTNYKLGTPNISYKEEYEKYYISLVFDMTEELLIGENGYKMSHLESKANEIFQVLQKLSDSYPKTEMRIYFDINIEIEGYMPTSAGRYEVEYYSDWSGKNFSWRLEKDLF